MTLPEQRERAAKWARIKYVLWDGNIFITIPSDKEVDEHFMHDRWHPDTDLNQMAIITDYMKSIWSYGDCNKYYEHLKEEVIKSMQKRNYGKDNIRFALKFKLTLAPASVRFKAFIQLLDEMERKGSDG